MAPIGGQFEVNRGFNRCRFGANRGVDLESIEASTGESIGESIAESIGMSIAEPIGESIIRAWIWHGFGVDLVWI